MATIFTSPPPFLFKPHLSLRSFTPSFPSLLPIPQLFSPLRAAGTEGGVIGAPEPSLLRRPLVSAPAPEEDATVIAEKGLVEVVKKGRRRKGEEWVDYEDKILEETVPLVGFVRMILHSDTYESGSRLSLEHEQTILQKLLPYHPEFEKKIGCGIDYITVGFHPEFENSRCMFIVKKDGEMVDFSYWKCIKGLIRKNYPQHADSFILRHFRRSRQGE